VYVIGLMSGTSADAVDAALVRWPDRGEAIPFELLAYREDPLPGELRQRVHQLAAGRLPAGDVLAELAALDVELGERFAEAALAVAKDAGLPMSELAIASHGQTVAHHPERRASLQIGDPAVIAERTGSDVVADFRPRDLAAGGEGAPLAPFFHWVAFRSDQESRVVLNLGGIANLTWLPRGCAQDEVIAFDCGPANALIDGVVSLESGGVAQFDRDGRLARAGTPHPDLLAELLADPFLTRPPPKSTGREHYGLAEAEALRARADLGLEDLVATLVAFSAEAFARACRDFLPGEAPRCVVAGGGGAKNPAMLDAIATRLPMARVCEMDTLGVPADAAEAIAFSLMGRNALLGQVNHLPRCTGAERALVLGEIVRGRP
jgi:anhydro-N-acetylmuramic acid kinase